MVREERTIYIKSPQDLQLTILAVLGRKRGIEDIVLTGDPDKLGKVLYYIELAEKKFGKELRLVRRAIMLVQTGKALKNKHGQDKIIEAQMGADFKTLAKMLLKRGYEVRESI